MDMYTIEIDSAYNYIYTYNYAFTYWKPKELCVFMLPERNVQVPVMFKNRTHKLFIF